MSHYHDITGPNDPEQPPEQSPMTTASFTTASPADQTPVPTTVVRPRHGWQTIDLRELWHFRDLLWVLTLRDIQVRYKQTALGVLWAVIQPVVMIVVFSVIFGMWLGAGNKIELVDGVRVPYPLWLGVAQVPWQLFVAAVTAASMSLVSNADMLRKIYFPRLLMPLAAMGAPLVDFFIGLGVLAGLMAWYDHLPGVYVALLPLLIVATLITAAGVGLLIAALNVAYRDFKYVVPFMMQVWFFLTPVILPVEKFVPHRFMWIVALNPMYGPIQAFRTVMVGTSVNVTNLLCSGAVGLVIFVVGLVYFARVERRFADIA